MRRCTLLFVINEERQEILLAMKKVRFGAGKYNGMGGGIEEGETPETAAVREAREEVGIEVNEHELEHVADINFSFENKPELVFECYTFLTRRWEGEPVESEEMAPQWFALTEIPFEQMWVDDRYWLPLVLKGERLKAAFHFSSDGSKILKQRIEQI